MKLFKMDVTRKSKGREVLAYADTLEEARALVASRFTGWEIGHCVEIPGPAHFVIAELEPD